MAETVETYLDSDTGELSSRMREGPKAARKIGHGLLDGSALPSDNPFRSTISAQAAELGEELDNHVKKLKAIGDDRRLSVDGRNEAIQDLRRDTAKTLDKMHRDRREELDLEIAKGTNSLPSEPPRPKADQHALAESLRQRLLAKSPADRVAKIKELASDGTELGGLALGAAYHDPLSETKSGINWKDEIMPKFHAAYHGEIFSRLEAAKRAMDLYRSNHESSRKIAATISLANPTVRLA